MFGASGRRYFLSGRVIDSPFARPWAPIFAEAAVSSVSVARRYVSARGEATWKIKFETLGDDAFVITFSGQRPTLTRHAPITKAATK